MDKLFVSFVVANKLKELGFDETCYKYCSITEHVYPIDKHGVCSYINPGDELSVEQFKYFECLFGEEFKCVKIPTHQQVVNWLEENYNIHLDRIWYDDKVTPTRWVYHVGKQYAGSDYDAAILDALKLIKKK